MKDVKVHSSTRTPRTLSTNARMPKELAKRAILITKEQVEHKQSQRESPEQYADTRLENATEETAYRAGQEGRRVIRKLDEVRKRYHTAQKQHHTDTGGTDQSRSSSSSVGAGATRRSSTSGESNAIRQGRQRVMDQAQTAQTTQQAITCNVRQKTEIIGNPHFMAKRATKAPKKTVKTTQKVVKTAGTNVQSMQRAVKSAKKSARFTMKMAQKTAQTARSAAKVAKAVIKWIVAAVKDLIAAIVAGGWVAIIIAVVAVLVVALLAVFGVFSANDAADGSKPMTEAVQAINTEFLAEVHHRIAALTAETEADTVEVICEGDMEGLEGSVSNWSDVVGIYAIKTSTDKANPSDVTAVTPENIETLASIFYDMNSVSYHTETETESRTVTDEHGDTVLDEDGNPMIESETTLYIYVSIVSKDYRDGAELYQFSASQSEMLSELMRSDYYPLFAELLGDIVGDGGEYGFGLDINPDLPANELGAQIVQAAKKYIGRSYSVMDCSCLARAAYRDCGLSSMNELNSAGMAKKCKELGVLFTDPSQLQAGDLIFFARKDPVRGPGYCTDTRRCGTGRCKRWMQIHHVAIYINDEFLIDSTGGDNSVQIRKLWGMNTPNWEWVCFGRPVD